MTTISKILTASLVSTSLMLPAAYAGSRDFIGGAAVGIGGTLLLQQLNKKNNNVQKKRTRSNNRKKKNTVRSVSGSNIAEVPTTRDQARDMQRRLNQLGFDAGTPDGIAGKRTRAAVSGFQHSIGSVQTGKLSQSDISILIQSTSQQAADIGSAYQANNQAFPMAPSLGQNSVFPGAPSPATLGQNGGNTVYPQPTFPTIAAPQFSQQAAGVGQPGTAFPLATAPGSPTQGQQASAFPKLGVPANNNAGIAAVNAPVFQVPANAVPMNALPNGAVAPTPKVVPAPGSVTPEVATTQQMVSLDTTAQQAFPVIEQFPSIFGISPGGNYLSSQASLTNEGFSECDDDGELLICEKDSNSMNDRVIIGRSEGGSDAVVYMAGRELTFKKPVRKEFIISRLSEAYPAILGQADQRLASLECESFLATATEVTFDPIMTSAELNADLIAACSTYFAISFVETTDKQMVESAVITLFDAGPLQNNLAGVQQQEEDLSKDLKF